MFDYVLMRALQSFELLRDRGVGSFLREIVYFRRKAIVVEKDLVNTAFAEQVFRQRGLRFVEMGSHSRELSCLKYARKSRGLKAQYYIRKGYAGHAIVAGNTVVGDIWYYSPKKHGRDLGHGDLKWLGIALGSDDVYSFDIYVAPEARGRGVSASLQMSDMFALREGGHSKGVAYYWADNLPAVWNSKVINGFKEIRELRVSRFFFSRKIVG